MLPPLSGKPTLAPLEVHAPGIGPYAAGERQPCRRAAAGWNEVDAIYWARRQTQLAAGAGVCEHGVHELRCADDRIDRTGLDAKRTADAACFIDHGELGRFVCAAGSVQGQDRATREPRKLANHAISPGRTAIDRCAVRNGLGIRTASVKSALSTLGLRQDSIDAHGQGPPPVAQPCGCSSQGGDSQHERA
jgi:hypothetical protein